MTTGMRSQNAADGPGPMGGRRTWRRACWIALIGLIQAAGAHAAGPAVGEAAPAFSLAGTDGRTYTLEGLLGEHGGLVLAWFPKAFTPG